MRVSGAYSQPYLKKAEELEGFVCAEMICTVYVRMLPVAQIGRKTFSASTAILCGNWRYPAWGATYPPPYPKVYGNQQGHRNSSIKKDRVLEIPDE